MLTFWDRNAGKCCDRISRRNFLLGTLYHVLGIDPPTQLPDHNGRPIYLLDDRRKIEEQV